MRQLAFFLSPFVFAASNRRKAFVVPAELLFLHHLRLAAEVGDAMVSKTR